jgi:hypothetical protein
MEEVAYITIQAAKPTHLAWVDGRTWFLPITITTSQNNPEQTPHLDWVDGLLMVDFWRKWLNVDSCVMFMHSFNPQSLTVHLK